jgi:hypothetical protein
MQPSESQSSHQFEPAPLPDIFVAPVASSSSLISVAFDTPITPDTPTEPPGKSLIDEQPTVVEKSQESISEVSSTLLSNSLSSVYKKLVPGN